jgi:autotransporter passenger strand-loop-strand repeat protein
VAAQWGLQMTDTVIGNGVLSSGQFVSFGDTLSAQNGGTVKFSFFTDNAFVAILNGGSAVEDDVTDYALEVVDGVDSSSIVANGATIDIQGDGLGVNLTVGPGGLLNVFGDDTPVANSGFASNTNISSGGLMQVAQNGLATGTILSGGELIVLSGSATQTTLSGGLELVSGAASFDSGAVVLSGGLLQAVSSGTISGATISSGGSAVAETAGTISGATVSDGGVMILRAGGFSSDTTVLAGGLEVISSGAVANADTILGEEIVLSGGTAANSEDSNFAVAIASGGLQLVSGGIALGLNVGSGGVEQVVSSGAASDDFVLLGGSAVAETGGVLEGDGTSGGFQVFSGGATIERYFGSATGVFIDLGATDTVSSTGIAISATVAGLQILSGGTTRATTVSGGGKQTISSGGIASGTIVDAGGIEIVSSGGTVQGATVVGGGTLVVEAGATVKGAVNGGGVGTLELAGGTGTLTGLPFNGDVTVAGPIAAATFDDFGTVKIDAGASFTAVGVAPTIGAGKSLIVEGTLSTAGTLNVLGSLALGGAATGARTLTGAGTLAYKGGSSTVGLGAVLSIAHVTQSAATVTFNTSLTYAKTWTQSSGTISVSGAKILTFTGTGDSFSGTLTGAGTVDFTAGSDTLNKVTLAAAGANITGAAVTLAGVTTLTKTLGVSSNHLTIAAAGATLEGLGTLSLSNLATNKIIGAAATATLTNLNDTIEGAGDLGGGSMILYNYVHGDIIGADTQTLTIDTGAHVITNYGQIDSEGAGGVTIKSAVVNNGNFFAVTGTLTASAAVTGTGLANVDGGTADFAAAFNQNVFFDGNGSGTLELAKSQSYTATVTGFSEQSEFDLGDVAYNAGEAEASYSDNGSGGGVLTVTNGSQTANIHLTDPSGGPYSDTFFTKADASGGTIVFFGTGPSAVPKHAGVLPFIAAMASHGDGGGHWVPTAESGRTLPLMVAVTSGR